MSYPVTSGGLYDLDNLDEELLMPTGPSPSVVADLLEPKLDNLRSLNKSKAKFQDLMRAADAGEIDDMIELSCSVSLDSL